MGKKEPEIFLDPADKKPRDKSEKKRLQQEEANKQKARYRELKQVVKQADATHKQRKKADKKHIKEILQKARLQRKQELKAIHNSPQPKNKMEEFNKKYQSEKHTRDMLIKQIKIETKTEYVKTLKQIDEAYPEVRRRQLSFKLKKWFFGVGKEFSRIRWIDRNRLFRDFVIIIIIVAVLALIFLAIDMAVLKWI